MAAGCRLPQSEGDDAGGFLWPAEKDPPEMAIGLHATKSDIDNRAGGLARDLENVLAGIRDFQQWLNLVQTTDAYLTGLGYTAPEIAILRGAFTDMNKVGNVYIGVVGHSPAAALTGNSKLMYDFR